MSELTFAKQFLSLLDTRPIKLPSDHVSDPRTYPPQGAYILPRMPNPMRKRPRPSSIATPSASTPTPQAQSIQVLFKPTRSTIPENTLTAPSLNTSIHELRTQYCDALGLPLEKVKLLFQKKPVADSKVLKEVLGEGEARVELGVMVLGGAVPSKDPSTAASGQQEKVEEVGKGESGDTEMPDAPEPVPEGKTAGEIADEPVVQGPGGREALASEEFWTDLRGYLVQRLRDEGEGDKVFRVFRDAWSKQS